MTDTPQEVTRDELERYRLSVVTAAARILGDHEPEFAYEVSLCKEAERYIDADPTLREIHTRTMIEERQLRDTTRARAADDRRKVKEALAVQHDMVADKLERWVAAARRTVDGNQPPNKADLGHLVIDLADVLAATLLMIGAELHDA